jgi:DNA repair protein RecN (Recombination protein N)
MLTTLRIKNLALVAELTIELQPGYNVITGETGAGKSILIGALNLVLGERADRTLLRSGCESCSVEAAFDVTALKAPIAVILEQAGVEPCEDGQLVLKRTFTATGTNRQFINGSPATLNVLAQVGELLVDIHGPHEHQSLLRPSCQLALLDAFAGLDSERDTFAELVRRRGLLLTEKTALIVDEKTYAQQLELLRFQVQEINAASLSPQDEDGLEEDYRRATNAARLLQLSQTALGLLSENEMSLQAQAGILGRTLQELQRVDAGAAQLLNLHQQTVSSLGELQETLSRYSEKIELEPARLQELEERVNLVQSLKRKYGSTVKSVLAFGKEAADKLKSLEQRDAELARLNGELEKVESGLWTAGLALSAHRREAGPTLGKKMRAQLAELGFKQSRFDVAITTSSRSGESPSNSGSAGLPHPQSASNSNPPPAYVFNSSGLDTIEFQFAPNPGEPPLPLRSIASSGELARVMLALKTVLAQEDQIPVLIFDEIDANVGGETARAVGEKLQRLALHRQVLCVTHLPQVAAPATAHYVASKEQKAGRTISQLTSLDKAQRVTELARMLGGQTEAARRHATAMLKEQVLG